MTDELGDAGRPRSGIDTTVPHSARIWNYWLGGTDNFPADRQAGEQTIAVLPEIVDIARASRQFLVRVVQYLAGPAGIRQFLDVGAGGQLSGRYPLHQRGQRRPGGRGGAPVEPGGADAIYPAQPGADRGLLRGPGPDRARDSVVPRVAARTG